MPLQASFFWPPIVIENEPRIHLNPDSQSLHFFMLINQQVEKQITKLLKVAPKLTTRQLDNSTCIDLYRL